MSSEQQHKTPILVVAPVAFPLDRGTPIRIERLATLMSSEYDVHVAAFHEGRSGSVPFTLHRIPVLPFKMTEKSGASVGKLICDFFLLLLVLMVIPRYKVALVDGHLHEGAFIGLIARLFYGTPVLYNAHGTLADEMAAGGLLKKDSLAYRFFAWFEAVIERSVNLVIAQSTMRRDDYCAKGIPAERIVVVEDAPLEEYDIGEPDADLVRRYKHNGTVVVIYTGELMPYQGIDLTLDVFPQVLQQCPNTLLILFGRPADPYRQRIQADHFEGKVVIVDDEPFSRLPHYLAIADVALAVRLYGGNVPGKLPIYMMAGKAIIGSDTEGINTVLEHGRTGWIIAPNADALQEALIHLIRHEDLRRSLELAVKESAQQRYSQNAVFQAMNDAYSRVLGTYG